MAKLGICEGAMVRSFQSPPQKGTSLSPHCSFAEAEFRRASLAEDPFRVVFSYFLRGLPVPGNDVRNTIF